MNKYDLEHVCTAHPLMSAEEWRGIYDQAWDLYYTPAHVERVMRRAAACGNSVGKVLLYCLWLYGCKTYEGVHPLEGGWLRRMYRLDRRPGLPVESPLAFYRRYFGHVLRSQWGIFSLWFRFYRLRRRIAADPDRRAYTDLALTPVADDAVDELALFNTGEGAKAALEKKRREDRARAAQAAAAQ